MLGQMFQPQMTTVRPSHPSSVSSLSSLSSLSLSSFSLSSFSSSASSSSHSSSSHPHPIPPGATGKQCDLTLRRGTTSGRTAPPRGSSAT
jgi:hypothetical protein